MEPSQYQRAIRRFVEEGSGNAVVNAVAGSGKTTTILWSFEAVSGQSCAFLCFNRSVAQHLRSKLPPGLTAMTLNALGHAALMRAYPKAELDRFKLKRLHRRQTAERPSEQESEAVLALAHFIKAYGLHGASLTRERMDCLLELALDETLRADIDRTKVKRLAYELIDLSLADTSTFDFDDQLYCPVAYGLEMTRYDWVVVDEAQDLSPVQLMLVRRIMKPGGRLLAVGDERQAIYGFRGADPDSIRRLTEEFDAQRLPLTITYRCGKRIVELAKRIVPYIEAADGAAEGRIEFPVYVYASDIEPGDLVLARRNAPLVDMAISLLNDKRSVLLMGAEELAKRLLSAYRSFGLTGKTRPLHAIDTMTRALDDMGDEDSEEYQSLRDVIEVTGSLQSSVGCATLREVIDAAASLAVDKDGPVLATIHKAKGLEAPRVHLLWADFIFNESNRYNDWRATQEWNLLYVAITRAQSTLRLETGYGEAWPEEVENWQAGDSECDTRARA